jgi:hypothetical protein
MYPLQRMNKSFVRLVVVTLLGMAIALGNPLSVDAKEKISKRALQEMIVGAKTAADHKAVADYYYAEAAQARAKADEHDQMVVWYRKAGEGVKKTPHAPGTIDHCVQLVKNYRATADDLTALAKEHEAIAANFK